MTTQNIYCATLIGPAGQEVLTITDEPVDNPWQPGTQVPAQIDGMAATVRNFVLRYLRPNAGLGVYVIQRAVTPPSGSGLVSWIVCGYHYAAGAKSWEGDDTTTVSKFQRAEIAHSSQSMARETGDSTAAL